MSVRPSVCPSVGAVQRSKVFFEANVGVAAEHACHARARAYATRHNTIVDEAEEKTGVVAIDMIDDQLILDRHTKRCLFSLTPQVVRVLN